MFFFQHVISTVANVLNKIIRDFFASKQKKKPLIVLQFQANIVLNASTAQV